MPPGAPSSLTGRTTEDEWDVGVDDLEQYLKGLDLLGHEGLERGKAARLLRKLSTSAMRERAKLQGTSLLLPLARRKARSILRSNGAVKVNLGSGTRQIHGWVNVDLVGMGADLPWNLNHGMPFPPSSAQAVFLEHVLEHFPAKAALRLLQETHQMLAPGGVVRVGVPDFGRYMTSYAGDGSFVERNRPGRPTPLLAVAEVITCHGHRSVWDGTTLVRVLNAAGFVDAGVRPFGESRLEPPPDTPARQPESVYAEAVKPAS